MENGLGSSVFLPTRVYGIGDRGDGGAKWNERLLPEHHRHDHYNTETIFKSMIIPCQERADASRSASGLTKHQTLQPQYGKGGCASFRVRLRWKMGLDADFS